MERTLIISKKMEVSVNKLEELTKDVPAEEILRKESYSHRNCIDLKNGDSFEALVFSETLRGKRGELLYLHKDLSVEEVEYCRRFLRDGEGKFADIVFF